MSVASRARGQINVNSAVSVIVVLAIFALLAAFLLPAGLAGLEGDETRTVTSDVGETTELDPDLNATVDSIDSAATPSTADITLQTSGESITKTIGNGTNATYSFTNGDVVVGVENIDTSPTPSTVTYNASYSQTFSYGNDVSSLWSVISIAIVLAAVLFIIGVGVRAADV